MASTSLTSLSHCSLYPNFITHQKSTSTINLSKQCCSLSINANFNLFSTRRNHSCHSFSQNFIIRRFGDNGVSNLVSTTSSSSIIRAYNGRNESGGNPQQKGSGLDWPILKRWDVPWPWQNSFPFVACLWVSFAVTGLLEIQALPYLGISAGNLTLDEKAELLFVDQRRYKRCHAKKWCIMGKMPVCGPRLTMVRSITLQVDTAAI